eukprot:scaffold3968_cov140-Skeletonema_menzelii.AAC.1
MNAIKNERKRDVPRMVERKVGDYLKEDDGNQRALVTRVVDFMPWRWKIKNTQDGQKSVLEDLPSDERGGKNQRHHLHVGKRSVGGRNNSMPPTGHCHHH